MGFERREVGPHDVQFVILYCGVCHSDLSQITSEWFPGLFPIVPGHEIVGCVTKVGEHVKNFKVGDLAGTGSVVDSCQICENCKHDMEQYCLEGRTFTYNNLGRDGMSTVNYKTFKNDKSCKLHIFRSESHQS